MAFKVLIGALLIATVSAWAQLIDPATLHFGPGAQTGLSCTSGPNAGRDAAMGCGNDPNSISAGRDRLDIFQNQGGAPPLVTPLVLILGVPNDSSGAAFGSGVDLIGQVILHPDYASSPGTIASGNVPTQYGMTGNPFGFPVTESGNATGYQGVLSTGDVYSALNVGAGVDNSVSMLNLTAFESGLGITATGFGLYVFSLEVNSSTYPFGGKSLLDIWFKTPLPAGTFATAYGRASDGTPYVTAWTNAGAGTAVPEPSTILLAGVALLLGAALRRR